MTGSLSGLAFLARLSLVILFPFSAADKVIHWQDALKQANSSFLPGGPVLLISAIAIEILTPIAIVFDIEARPASLILAFFCIVTAILYHPFWKFPRFWSGNNNEGRSHFWDFLKNFGLAGGLLFIVIGGPFGKPLPTATHSLAPTAAVRPANAAPLATTY